MTDLNKLTVPQLKALCKERRIAGYSKLNKAALLQKLAGVPAQTHTVQQSAPVPSTPQQDSTVTQLLEPLQDRTASTHGTERNTHIDTSVISTSTSTQQAPPTRDSLVFRAPESLPARLPEASQDPTATRRAPSTTLSPPQWNVIGAAQSTRTLSIATSSTQKTFGAKRNAHIDISVPAKRIRTSASTSSNAAHLTTSTSQQTSPVGLSAQSKASSTPFNITKQPPAASGTIKPDPGRFKPLAIARPKHVDSGNAANEPSHWQALSTSRAADSSLASIPAAKPLPFLSQISFPPKAAERKLVYRWAIILSALSPTERQACRFVSRTFRYAVYLSAVHILSRDYPGRRLDLILKQYSKNMTNFWPYLRYRMAEVSERRLAFKLSFLGRYADSVGYHPLSRRLWTSPDDEKQVEVALRFVLTRMWFATSIGAYGHDAATWSKCVVHDVREVVQGDVWHVIAEDGSTGASCNFYVLGATCEVVGRPGTPSSLSSSLQRDENKLEHRLRADWTAFILERSRSVLTSPDVTNLPSILDCVTWSNTEDYHLGVSKAWLRRIQDQCQGQDVDSVAKKRVAGRYILACVVANGISGPWMSTSAMAQEFAGLPAKNDTIGGRTVGRFMDTVNMYLAAIHFTTSKGEALHTAVAVVQTPGREYYVLRDNGMQVGCEEEGIPEVWQQILRCDTLGRAC